MLTNAARHCKVNSKLRNGQPQEQSKLANNFPQLWKNRVDSKNDRGYYHATGIDSQQQSSTGIDN